MKLSALMTFVQGALSGGRPGVPATPSASRVTMALAVAAAVCWLSGDLIAEGMTLNWTISFGTFMTTCFAGYGVGKFVDNHVASGGSTEDLK